MLKITEQKVRQVLRPLPSAGQRVCKKYRRAYAQKIKRREYRRLKAIVPSVADKDKVSKVTVIEEAIRYIDELHLALAERFQICPDVTDKPMDCSQLMDAVRRFVILPSMGPGKQANLGQPRNVSSLLSKPHKVHLKRS